MPLVWVPVLTGFGSGTTLTQERSTLCLRIDLDGTGRCPNCLVTRMALLVPLLTSFLFLFLLFGRFDSTDFLVDDVLPMAKLSSNLSVSFNSFMVWDYYASMIS